MAEPLLVLDDLHVSYGPVPAVRGVSLHVDRGEAVALLGRNGTGRTTTLRAAAGLLPAQQGTIQLNGQDVTAISADRRVGLGLALAPEGRGVFPQLTVRENLLMGAFARKLDRGETDSEIERVTTRFLRLRERLSQKAGSLSGGEQQMLAVARGLMADPKLLMIDEPSLGLAPVIVEELYDLLGGLRAEGLTLLVVEQYVELALDFADRAYVLDKGRVTLEGATEELAASEGLVEAYMAGAVPQRAG